MINRIAEVFEAGKVRLLKRELPEPADNQALVEIHASCICGSDLHIFKGRHPAVKLPVTVGHEFSGIVRAVGKDVQNVRVGDRVTVEPIVTCGKCPACLHGEYSYCENISFTYRQGDGALADYFIGRADRMFRLPDDISFEEAALVEPMAVALHAVRRADIKVGDRVAIIGAGAIGILVAALCRRLGNADVVVSDVSPFRLALAKEMGAMRTVNAAEESIIDAVGALSGGKGFEKAFECVGNEATLKQAISCVRTNGLVTDIGIFERPDIHLDVSVLVNREIRLQGSQGYCWDFESAIRLVRETGAKRLITHKFGLEEMQTAFETVLNPEKNAVKVCIVRED